MKVTGTTANAKARTRVRHTLFASALLLLLGWGVEAAETVDLALVLGADVSRSVDAEEFRVQREGYAKALTDPRVLSAIRSGENGAIAICLFEWAGVGEQQLIVDWTVIRNANDAAAVAEKILAAPRSFFGRTAIGEAIDFALHRFDLVKGVAGRQVIDISGDGTNTNGRFPTIARDAAVAAGVTINALAILSPVPLPMFPEHTHPPGGLENYFKEYVIGGRGAFSLQVDGFHSFAQAMVQKLIVEISDANPEPAVLAVLPPAD
ncbi:MAG: DUF1194 domain-containing protein [Alphaproteobacteria bacterium]|nr:DUF1194 domain-containing protein [Alphaproteobacteria bacterium]